MNCEEYIIEKVKKLEEENEELKNKLEGLNVDLRYSEERYNFLRENITKVLKECGCLPYYSYSSEKDKAFYVSKAFKLDIYDNQDDFDEWTMIRGLLRDMSIYVSAEYEEQGQKIIEEAKKRNEERTKKIKDEDIRKDN